MAQPSPLDRVLDSLAQEVHRALRGRVVDPAARDYGLVVNSEWGLGDPSAVTTAAAVLAAGMVCLARPADCRDRLPAVEEMLSGLLAGQGSSGLIDLRSCNFDSAPDTAFAVQQLGGLLELIRAKKLTSDAAWAGVESRLKAFLRRTVDGLRNGGFHTPNHRWVIASALAQLSGLFPDLRGANQPVIDAYLREGVDIDDEGFYSERSAGVYDAVSNRSLLMLADSGDWAFLPELVRRNLQSNVLLLRPDFTIETGLSSRQDRGLRPVPIGLASCYLLSHARQSDAAFVAVAEGLWRAYEQQLSSQANQPLIWMQLASHAWLAYALLKHGTPALSDWRMPESVNHYFPGNGFWRVRRGRADASFFRGQTNLGSIRSGAVELASIRIAQPYFGVGQFKADEFTVAGNSATLMSSGHARPGVPGYILPLGQPVGVTLDAIASHRSRRSSRALPAPRMRLCIDVRDEGLELHLSSIDNLPGVPAQISLDFLNGDEWETLDGVTRPSPGQIFFLKQGKGRMCCGLDCLEIDLGEQIADAHRMWEMRDAAAVPPGMVRVLIALETPMDVRLIIRASRRTGQVGAWRSVAASKPGT